MEANMIGIISISLAVFWGTVWCVCILKDIKDQLKAINAKLNVEPPNDAA
jgi:hypothetical protein